MRRLAAVITLFSLPLIASAQANLGTFLANLNNFLGRVIIPFLLGMAFLIFVWNAIRYFVLEGNNQQGQENARALALYSILAFVLIVIFWGIVNVLVDGFGLGGVAQPGSDYVNVASP